MIAAAILLDGVTALRATLDTFLLKVLQQCNFFGSASVSLVLFACALMMPTTPMVPAGLSSTNVAAKEAVEAAVI